MGIYESEFLEDVIYMFKELETKRLRLKNIGYEDADFVYKEFSTDEVNNYLYDAEPISSTAEAKQLIEFYTQEEPRNQHRWIIIMKDTNEKIGTCGFHCWDRMNGIVEIGYDLQPDYWRKGYTSEALEEIIKFAKNEMNVISIIAHIAERNIASIQSVIKLGFYKTNDTYFEEFHEKRYLHYIYQLDV